MAWTQKIQRQMVERYLGDAYTDRDNGLYLSTLKVSRRDLKTTVDGEQVFHRKGARYSYITFMPELRDKRDGARLTDTLMKGIRAAQALIAAVESGELKVNTFMGWTNRHMAVLIQRFGFSIADQDRNPYGTLRKRRKYRVVGSIPEIKAKIEEFAQSDQYRRLEGRARKIGSV